MTAAHRQEAAAVLRQWLTGGAPPGIALMRLILLVPGDADPAAFLEDAIAAEARDEAEAAALRRLAADAARDKAAWERVRATAAAIPHDEKPLGTAADEVRRLALRFDAAARVSPEASVALYSLGDPARLEAATAEIVAWLAAQELIGADREALDLGCGIGRLSLALAARVKRVAGCDISEEMVRVARARAEGVPNVDFRVTDGLGLAAFADAAFDLVLAADVFPYLVAAGGGLAGRHVAEAARVLRAGGTLAILNLSYRGEPERDAADLAAWAEEAGLRVAESGTKPFRLWDAAVFRLVKPDG